MKSRRGAMQRGVNKVRREEIKGKRNVKSRKDVMNNRRKTTGEGRILKGKR